jgi:sugar phosphate isomerase/epimerase
LQALAEIADEFGIELALEFRSDSRWLSSLDTAAAIVSQVDHPRIGLCLDLFHYYLGPSKFEDLNAIVVGLLKSVQFSDLIGTPRELARDTDRILPGEGDFELSAIVGRLQKYDYSGRVSVEVPNPHLWPIACDRVADMAHQAISRIWPEDQAVDDLELPDLEQSNDNA